MAMRIWKRKGRTVGGLVPAYTMNELKPKVIFFNLGWAKLSCTTKLYYTTNSN